jgi:phosphonate transport system substrate-binding protein
MMNPIFSRMQCRAGVDIRKNGRDEEAPDGREIDAPLGLEMAVIRRRSVLAGGIAALLLCQSKIVRAGDSVSVGLNPLFLDSDIQLISLLEKYLSAQLRRSVQLIKRRTYQEITAMLLSGQLDAAWVCDDPYVQHEDQLALLAVPLYRHQPLYQTYVIVNERNAATSFDEIRGTVHAFSDPDSTSGFLVTRYLLALRQTTPAQFFRASFFTYGHRNVVRAVASGLAQSGSIDGYVWEVMREREPELINKTRVVYRSEQLGFPPIVGLKSASDPALAQSISAAFIGMADDPLGRNILEILELDGFTQASPDLYRGTLEKWLVVRAQA